MLSKTCLKAQQMQAAYARRREQENMRVQRVEEINRYYDHWGKVTTRFENWTTPAYYRKVEQQLNAKREKVENLKKLGVRQLKLRELLKEEQVVYDQEMKVRSRARSRQIIASNDMLEKIDGNLKEREKMKRKLELEAKLYGRWRHGVDDENRIFESSKTDNEVLAKLNWIDKQIDDQLLREKEEKETEERNLRMQEEIRKAEETQKERQEIREKEITEIRALQERHMTELKECQNESEDLKISEKDLRMRITRLDKEMDVLDESSTTIDKQPMEYNNQAHNLRKIKSFIRQRSDLYRKQIQVGIDILKRIEKDTTRRETIKDIINNYEEELDLEDAILTQIEGMYESEVKYNLQRLESLWQKQHTERYYKLQNLIKEEQYLVNEQLKDNLQKQTDLIEMRSTHLSSIENSNDKLKVLINESNESPRNRSIADTNAEQLETKSSMSSVPSMPFVPVPSVHKYKPVDNLKTSLMPMEDNVSLRSSSLKSTTKSLTATNNPSRDNLFNIKPEEPRATPNKPDEPRAPLSNGDDLSVNVKASDSSGLGKSLSSQPRSDIFGGSSISDLVSVPSSADIRRRSHFDCRNKSQIFPTSSLPKVTNSFSNLNLDVWKDLPSAKGGIDSPRLQSSRSMHIVTPENVERPKHGRRRVAWL